jgi:hypothetical protein
MAATISRIEVTSNGKKYGPNSTRARAWTLPPWFTAVKSGSSSRPIPMPSHTAVATSATRPAPSSTASHRWAFNRSTRLSLRSTPSSMITNRNRTMMAPAYTMIWTTNRNGDPRIRKNTARVKKFTMSSSAACTAFRASTMAIPDRTEIGAITQNTYQSATGG